MRTIWRVVLPRTIESSTTTTRARDLGERVELQPDPLLAQALVRLDERPADVAVLDQPLAERDPVAREKPIAAGVPESGIGMTRSASTGASSASRSPIRTRAAWTSMPVEPRVGAGRGRRTRRCRARRRRGTAWAERTPSSSIARPRPVDLALDGRRRRGRARTSPRRRPSRRRAGRGRAADPVRVAERDERPSASATTEYAPSSAASSPRRPPRAAPRRSRSAPRSPRCRTSSRGGRRGQELLAQLGRVREVAVVPERDRCARGRGGRAAARSPSASSRSSSSACGRSRARPAGRELLLRRTPADEPHLAERGQPAPGRRRRSRPTPGRGAGARRARSTRGARRRARGDRMPKTPHI